jgi:hypothetical protein
MVDFGLEIKGRGLERVVGGQRKGKDESSALNSQERSWENQVSFLWEKGEPTEYGESFGPASWICHL